eukprot:CAMPEP_0172512410 /NCGR_PEP_ID=MMETSP1066-20121228/244481_1 /TAXON_ID=671091 /ORGANISM="Coscinodiscus wailesii, Strain CCMP2513" /LENGTH=71 /DNA_ID=CAMNT_0013292217 /DNA_START=1 /DNA_END=213 /DNA_ORIENTATION=+
MGDDIEKIDALWGAPSRLLPERIVEMWKEEKGCFSLEGRALPDDWSRKRPEELNPGQVIEVTRLIYGPWEE